MNRFTKNKFNAMALASQGRRKIKRKHGLCPVLLTAREDKANQKSGSQGKTQLHNPQKHLFSTLAPWTAPSTLRKDIEYPLGLHANLPRISPRFINVYFCKPAV